MTSDLPQLKPERRPPVWPLIYLNYSQKDDLLYDLWFTLNYIQKDNLLYELWFTLNYIQIDDL